MDVPDELSQVSVSFGDRRWPTGHQAQFAKYGLNLDRLPNYPNQLANPRGQVVSIGAEREVVKRLFAGPTTSTSTGPTSFAPLI